MSLLIIRNSRRFAVRQSILLALPGGQEREGLLVEVSLSGCRISNVGDLTLGLDDSVTVKLEGFDDMPALVRWTGEGVVGLRLSRPLHCSALERIIGHCRPSRYSGTNLLYGT